MKAKNYRFLPWIIMGAVVLAWVFFYMLHIEKLLDAEMSGEMVLSGLLAKEHSIITPNWNYSTDIRVLNNQLFFSHFFRHIAKRLMKYIIQRGNTDKFYMFFDHIIHIIQERRRGIEELDKGSTPRLYSYVIGEYFNRKMVTDKKFTVDADKCIGCGKCQKVCPVDNIKGTPPMWLHNGQCTSCLACYHYCPEHAINYGRITRKRDQYYFNKHADRR